jgi:hypothetical protein
MGLRPYGSADTSFGTGGIVKTAFSGLNDALVKVFLLAGKVSQGVWL